eukprot:6341633-Amphidinium_carterae.1
MSIEGFKQLSRKQAVMSHGKVLPSFCTARALYSLGVWRSLTRCDAPRQATDSSASLRNTAVALSVCLLNGEVQKSPNHADMGHSRCPASEEIGVNVHAV